VTSTSTGPQIDVSYPGPGATLKSGSSANVQWGDKGFNRRSLLWQNEYVGQLQLVKGGDLSQNPTPIPPVNFSVLTGSVAITVPNAQDGDDYQLLLTFVSLNQTTRPNVAALSDEFTIENDSNTTSTFVAGSSAVTGVLSATSVSVTLSTAVTSSTLVSNSSASSFSVNGTTSTFTTGSGTTTATSTFSTSTDSSSDTNDSDKNKSSGAVRLSARSVGITILAGLVGSMLVL